MSDYLPSARRPIAGAFRRTADGTVRLCVRLGIHPDAVSYASVVASAGAALCFWHSGTMPWLLALGSLLCFLRLWFNMLDGMVALASGKASRRGEIVNELPDRVSDVLVFAASAHSGLGATWSGYWAAILAVFTAYVGIFGQAVGAKRQFGGLMAKPWRMVTLAVGSGAILAMTLLGKPDPMGLGLSILDWTHLVIVLGCVQTVIVRLKRILAALEARP